MSATLFNEYGMAYLYLLINKRPTDVTVNRFDVGVSRIAQQSGQDCYVLDITLFNYVYITEIALHSLNVIEHDKRGNIAHSLFLLSPRIPNFRI